MANQRPNQEFAEGVEKSLPVARVEVLDTALHALDKLYMGASALGAAAEVA